jgi:serine/threonine protein kinase/Leucine-rich repeat (LRR) protein
MSDDVTMMQGEGWHEERYHASARIGRYVLVEPIGEGGMGVVWLGIDEVGRRVVLKLMPVDLTTPREQVERFMREGRILTTLKHAGICRIHEINQSRDTLYIAMEHVPGVSLDKVIRYVNAPTVAGAAGRAVDVTTLIETIRQTECTPAAPSSTRERRGTTRRLPLQQALAIIHQVCQAVRFAHEHGVLHRDIKPANIMIRPDGRPVLLDFGIARYSNDVEATLTRTGRVFGTIAYMAPEQALSAHDVDERADVYGIGAVMYQLVTGKRHFVSCGDLVRDVRRLKDYEPIRPRLHCRDIDPDLEAIMLKALEADRRRRYHTIGALAEDIRRYRTDRPVTAKRATPLYLLTKQIRKHRRPMLYGLILLTIAAVLGAYHGIIYYRRWGKWEQVAGWDFTRLAKPPGQFRFVDTDLTAAPPWRCDSTGLVMDKAGETCWLSGTRVPGDVRVVVSLSFDRPPDGFELIVNGADDSLPTYSFVPRGYSCQFGGYFGSLAFVSVNESPSVAALTDFAYRQAEAGRPVELMFQRRGENIRLFIDGEEAIATRDLVPFEGEAFSRIGFRCYTTEVHIHSLKVYRYALPRSVSPLVAGGALLAAGRAPAAIETYLHIADNHRDRELGALALLRAFAAAGELDSTTRCVLRDSLVHLFATRHPSSRHLQTLREEELVDLWERTEYESVLRRLPAHCRQYPQTDIAQRIVPGAPPNVKQRLVPYLGKLGRILTLRLDNLGLSDLTPLIGCDLLKLTCNDNDIRDLTPLQSMKRLMWFHGNRNAFDDLSPLAGLPLFSLEVSDNEIDNLTPLTGAPLRLISAAHNRIETLEPLAGMNLTVLDIRNNRIEDLSPLSGMSLTSLRATANRFTDLGPLAGMPLTQLECGDAGIRDLTPLHGMPLKYLSIDYNMIRDVSALRDMPLRYLNLAANPLRDLSPLHTLPLQYLNLTSLPIESLEALRGLSLQTLWCMHTAITDLEPVADMRLIHLSCSDCRITHLPRFSAATLTSLRISDNRIGSLAPLAGLAMTHLFCDRNPLSSLQGITGMPLQELSISELDNGGRTVDLTLLRAMPLRTFNCRDTRVSGLEPLAGAPLKKVNCQGSGITTLGPLLADPPDTFHFYNESLGEPELAEADSLWAADTATAHLARTARLYRLVRSNHLEALRGMATRFDGRDYLFVPIHLDRAHTMAFVKKSRARLAFPTSDREAAFLARLCDWSSQRIAPRYLDGRWTTASGETVDRQQRWFKRGKAVDYVARDSTNLGLNAQALVFATPPATKLPFTIVWED